jgi:hypothetical protein
MNAYASIHALLKLFGMKEGAAVYTLGAYAVFANFINFQAYSVSMMVRNAEKLYGTLIDGKGSKSEENNVQGDGNKVSISAWDVAKAIRTVLVSLFGLAAFAVFSYNLTRKAFVVIPGLCNASEATAGSVAVVSGATSLITSILGKSLTLHSSLDKSPQKIIAGVSDGYRNFIPFHIVFGAIYVLSMAAMYFVGTLNIAKEKHWDYLSTASLGICSAVAFSGGLLELSFAALKMFDHISNKVQNKLPVQVFDSKACEQINDGDGSPLNINAVEAVNDADIVNGVTGNWCGLYNRPPEADLAAIHVAAAGWS